MSETKSISLITEIEDTISLLKENFLSKGNISNSLKHLIVLTRKLDHINNNELKVLDEILFNNFMRSH